MKKYLGITMIGILFLGFMGVAYSSFMGPQHAEACGWGNSKGGGGDYTPQQRGSRGAFNNRESLTKEQAYDIVSNHVKKLNPNLSVGEIIDAGSFFEAEILSEAKEVIERLAVDKRSGRIMPIG